MMMEIHGRKWTKKVNRWDYGCPTLYGSILSMMNELDQLKEEIAMDSFGRSRSLALAAGQCVKCGTYDLNFRDEPSQREYKLTVWCQSCQDDFFGVEEE